MTEQEFMAFSVMARDVAQGEMPIAVDWCAADVGGDLVVTGSRDQILFYAPPESYFAVQNIEASACSWVLSGEGRELLRIDQDGTVTGEIEDAGPAAKVFVETIRSMFQGWRHPIPSDLLSPEHDEAIYWITENCMAIRRDNGDMDYSLGAMIAAYEAGRARSQEREARARAALERARSFVDACATEGELTPNDEAENPCEVVIAIDAALQSLKEPRP